MNGRQEWTRWSFIALLCLLTLAAIVRILYAIRPAALWWDETIYLGMAKYLFSGGTLGYWEMFRPPMLPVMLGSGWVVGIGIIAWGKALMIGFSLGIIALAYVVGERLRKGAGLVAAAMLSFLPVFFNFGNKLLSDIPSAFFLLLGVFLIMRENWLWAGCSLGFAFLMRFIHNLSVLAVALAVIVAWLATGKPLAKRSWKPFLRTALLLAAGFIVIVAPYFIITAVQYGDPLATLKEGSRVFTEYNNFVYDEGNLYYLTGILLENPLFIFALVGLVAFFLERRWKETAWNAILFPTVLITAYFLIVAHKEIRFFLVIFPLLALLSGVGLLTGISWLQGRWRTRRQWTKKACERKAAWVMGILLAIMLASSAVGIARMVPESLAPAQETYYHFFDDAEKDDEYLLTTNPQFMSFSDKPITFLRRWELAASVMEEYGTKASHVAVDDCEYPCEPGTACVGQREDFLKAMEAHDELFSGTYTNWKGASCNLTIWKN
jgi:hypothetical protein